MMLLVLGGALLLYFVAATWIARTKSPWCDEGWFVCPAYNLAFHGKMSTNVLEPTGHYLNAYLKGIQERTYMVMPLHPVMLAGWFHVVGFSLFTARLYSILWGGATLVLLFSVLRRFVDRTVAWVALYLTAIDFVFLWDSADVRMDIATNALALCGIGSYLFLRERNMNRAVLVSQLFGALSILMHPNGMLGVLAVAALAWKYDRRRLRPLHALLAACPYVVGFGLWGLYILQSPSDFTSQFFANAAGRNTSRLTHSIQPWLSVWELILQYGAAYTAPNIWSVRMNPWMFIVPFFYLAAILFAWRAKGQRARILNICMFAYLAGMTFLVGFKQVAYLAYVVPLHNALFAYMLVQLWHGRVDARVTAALLAGVFALVEITTTVQHVRADERNLTYRATVDEMKRARDEKQSIVASAAFGSDLGYYGFTDDTRLGFYTGRRPDVLVVDRSYRRWFELFQKEEPSVFAHVSRTLTSDYKLVDKQGDFWIFRRSGTESATQAVPPSAQALFDRILEQNGVTGK